jgi:hypothetical protein
MRRKILVVTLPFLCCLNVSARAQVTIDISTITCKQFRGYTVTNPANIALWLSGYHNSKKNNTIVKVESFKENLENLKDYCITHPAVMVMHAAEAILGNERSSTLGAVAP